MVDDFEFNKQFKNMGIDTNAVKNTQIKDSKIEVINVSDDKTEASEPKEETSGEQSKSVVSDDALESIKAAHQHSQEQTNQRIKTLKAEINKVLAQFHEQIKSLQSEISQLKRAPAPEQKPEPQQTVQEESPPMEKPKGEYDPGGSKVSVENIFDFSNAKDFKRI